MKAVGSEKRWRGGKEMGLWAHGALDRENRWCLGERRRAHK